MKEFITNGQLHVILKTIFHVKTPFRKLILPNYILTSIKHEYLYTTKLCSIYNTMLISNSNL